MNDADELKALYEANSPEEYAAVRGKADAARRAPKQPEEPPFDPDAIAKAARRR